MKTTDETKPKTLLELQIEALSKRRVRLPQWAKDYAHAMGWPLRGRGRPRKAAGPSARLH